MKTFSEWLKEQSDAIKGMTEAGQKAEYDAWVKKHVSPFTGYDVFEQIKGDIPVRASLPPRDKPFSFVVVGITDAKIIEKDGKPSWAPVECLLKDGSTITLFGSDLVKAERELGASLKELGAVRISRLVDGSMKYAKAA